MAKQPGIRTKLTSFLGNEDGIMAVIFAVMLPVFLVIAALAIDMGYAYWKRNIVQVDASVSALAGAGIAMDDASIAPGGIITFTLIDKDGDGVPDNDDSNSDGVRDGAVILIEALLYAEKTISNEDILATVDVLPGNWDPATRVFTSAGTWDPGTLLFDDSQQQEYDTDTGTFTNVDAPVVPLNAVMTTTRRAEGDPSNNPLPLFLAAAVGLPTANINTTAIATIDGTEPPPLDACISALNRNDSRTFYINGTADVYSPGCNIDVWSDDPCAIRAVGGPVISVVDSETEDGSNDGSVNVASAEGQGVCDTPNVEWYPEEGPIDGFAPPDDVPFSYLDPPGGVCVDGINYCGLDTGSCDGTEDPTEFHAEDYTDGVLTLGTYGSTTVYCGGISIFGPAGSEVVFQGDFVIRGGEFEIAASVAISSGVNGTGFYLMDGTYVNMHGGPGAEGIGLVAQDSGPLKDFIFFEDPNSTVAEPKEHSLRGTPLGAFDGILFFQNSDVEFKGTADGLLGVDPDGGCTILIADEIYFNGTTQFATDMSGCGGAPPTSLGELTLRLRN